MKKSIRVYATGFIIISLILFGGCSGKLPSVPPSSTSTNGILPETEQYVFASWNDKAVTDRYNIHFSGQTAADLDGDGKVDAISIFSGKPAGYGDDEYREYQSAAIKVNGQETTINVPEDEALGGNMENGKLKLEGFIIDIDEKDGRKEICIFNDQGEWPDCCIVLYDGKTLKQLPWRQSVRANGSGYILAYDWLTDVKLAGADGMNVLCIQKYMPDGSGFASVKEDRYRTVYSVLPPVDPAIQGAASQWDQRLADRPGGTGDRLVPAGTEIFFGWYDPLGWMEVHSRDGTTLGWLDCRKVDWNAYTGGAYTPQFLEWSK